MNIYIVMLTINLLSLYFYRRTKIKVFAVIPYIMMAGVGGLRSEVGVDYLSYEAQFYDIVNGVGWSTNFEPGFKLLVKLIDELGFSYQVLFLTASILTCFFYYKFIEENSKSFELSTIMFMCLGPFYLASYNAVRQSLAIAIFLYALKYLNIEMKKYYIWVFISATIHLSALLFIIIPFVANIVVPFLGKLRKAYFLMLFFGVTIVFIALRTNIVDRVIDMFFPGRIRMTDYAASMDNTYLAYLAICLIVLVINNFMNLGVKQIYIFMLTYTCLLITVAFLVPRYSMFLTRFVSWGTPALIIVLPEIKRKVKPQKLYSGIIYCGSIVYYVMLINSTGAKLLPYATNLSFFK